MPVETFSLASWSHGEREARLPTISSQSAGEAELGFQHHSSRTSVSGTFHGSLASAPPSGVLGKAFQRAVYGAGAGLSSSVTVPVYPRGSTGGAPLRNSHTSTK